MAKHVRDMTDDEYTAALSAATRQRQGGTKREPKPVSTLTKEEYAAAKKAAGLNR